MRYCYIRPLNTAQTVRYFSTDACAKFRSHEGVRAKQTSSAAGRSAVSGEAAVGDSIVVGWLHAYTASSALYLDGQTWLAICARDRNSRPVGRVTFVVPFLDSHTNSGPLQV